MIAATTSSYLPGNEEEMEHEEAVRRGLDGHGKKSPTHTHGVHYERAANGGYIAHVHKHHGKGPQSEGHSHTEEHVLADKKAQKEHFEEHMGDQPAAGEMPEEEQNPAEQAQAAPPADAAAGAGAAAVPGM
jgi:hypothetical protein